MPPHASPARPDGVLVIDKPQGLTSHDVVAAVRRLLRERQIGHTGTLDPLATGVLPLACGSATRLVRFLSASTKEYDATIQFGRTTTTFDVTGETTSESHERPSREAVEHAIESLTGRYLQTPPAFSAKKVSGQRAYELARRNEAVDLKAVPIEVSQVRLMDFTGTTAAVSLTCSAGFYVRVFAHELGGRVGVGACLAGLRRTRSGDFRCADAVPLEGLERHSALDRIIPLEKLLPGVPAVRLTDEGCVRASHGREIESVQVEGGEAAMSVAGQRASTDEETAGWVRLLDREGRLVALGRMDSRRDTLHPSVVLI